jgi:hypothetical protein
MRTTDQPEKPLDLTGIKTTPPPQKPQEREVSPGVWKNRDGTLETRLPLPKLPQWGGWEALMGTINPAEHDGEDNCDD